MIVLLHFCRCTLYTPGACWQSFVFCYGFINSDYHLPIGRMCLYSYNYFFKNHGKWICYSAHICRVLLCLCPARAACDFFLFLSFYFLFLA